MSALTKSLIDGADRLVRVVSPQRPRLDAAAFLRGAERKWGAVNPLYREALEVLLESAEREADLSLFGRHALRWDLQRMLRNCRLIERHAATTPAAAAPREAPIFILGLPRTGSTFLHRLLAEDPHNLVPRCWQTLEPAPRPAGFDPQQDPRARRAERMLAGFGRLAPDLAALHPLGADLPQECTEITAHTFCSLAFDTILRVPGYLDWLDRRGHDEAYAFHRRFLRFLDDGGARRWVLKCPDHVFALDALLKIYPDARLVVTHRDPLAVIPSVARLTEVLRQPFSRRVDARAVGAEVAGRWADGARRLTALAERQDLPRRRIFHLHYALFVSNPVAAVATMYQYFGLPLEAATRERFRRFIDTLPRGGYGRNQYSFDSFGLDRRALERTFAGYCERFGLGLRTPAAGIA
ncbi:MAG TPA: sulfotransferase [Nevskia sp.]|nr:sulfotransferase [Nevskia sp.]